MTSSEVLQMDAHNQSVACGTCSLCRVAVMEFETLPVHKDSSIVSVPRDAAFFDKHLLPPTPKPTHISRPFVHAPLFSDMTAPRCFCPSFSVFWPRVTLNFSRFRTASRSKTFRTGHFSGGHKTHEIMIFFP